MMTVGGDGEFYFHPQKPIKLSNIERVGKSRVIPILPHPNVVNPESLEWLNVFEMSKRRLLAEDGAFGLSFYSAEKQKVSLVGSIARIKSRRIMDDGRSFVVVEGEERFYVEEFLVEKPFLKARVRTFIDRTEVFQALDPLARHVFEEVSVALRFMKLLHPSKNYTLSSQVLATFPAPKNSELRYVSVGDKWADINRVSRFSFAVMDLLSISHTMKLSLLQVI